MMDQDARQTISKSLFDNLPAVLAPGGAAHQLALTSRHSARLQAESWPLTGLGEQAGHFRTRDTHMFVKSCLRSGYTRSRITLGFLLVPSGYFSRQPVHFVYHLERKSKGLAKGANSSASFRDLPREHMPIRNCSIILQPGSSPSRNVHKACKSEKGKTRDAPSSR